MGSLFRRFIGSKRPSCSDWYLLSPRPRLSSLLPSRTLLLEVLLPCRLPLQSTRLLRLSPWLLQPPPLWPPWPSLTLLTTTSSPPPPTWPATLTTALPTTAL